VLLAGLYAILFKVKASDISPRFLFVSESEELFFPPESALPQLVSGLVRAMAVVSQLADSSVCQSGY
jgi:hypothetical protein